MGKRKKADSREIGLNIVLTFGNYFFKTDDLHYGYWTEGLDVNTSNFPKAQENYSAYLVSHMPEGIKSVLDVGCGTGKLADRLIGMGYTVDCVSPSPYLTGYARKRLGDRSRIYECKYEDLNAGKTYDMVLFSESFQYINPVKSLEKSREILNGGGYILISDFFRTEAEGLSPMGGGHRLAEFYGLLRQSPFAVVKDIDITANTAPTIDLANDVLNKVGRPVWDSILYYLDKNYPVLARFLRWKFRKKIEKFDRKYFSGQRNGKNFSIYKSYRLILLKKL